MDDKRFDLLAKSLSSGLSRRSLLRSLAAAVGVAVVGVEQASAAPGGVNGNSKCYGTGSQCTNAKQCCSGTCTNRTCAPAVPVDPCAGKNCDDGNECTTNSCSGGVCSHTPTPDAPCADGKVCSESGVCNGCGPGMNCPTLDNSCQVNSCDVATNLCNIYDVAQDTPCDSGAGTCDGAGTCVYPVDPCANVTCNPKSECVGTYCDQGQCLPKPYGPGTQCSLGICDGKGACISDPCANVSCNPTECMTSTCVQGACDDRPETEGTPCSGGTCDGAGNCHLTPTCGGQCDAMFPCPMGCMCSGGICS